MSGIRVLRPHAVRPHLSLRYQCLGRCRQSTATTSPAPTLPSSPPAPPPPPSPGFFRRYRSTLLWTTFSLTLGLLAGNTVLHTLAPPPMPAAGTHEDDLLLRDLSARIDAEFKVKVLRGKCLGVAKQLKGQEGGWVEILPPAEGEEEEGRRRRDKILGGRLVESLQGAKGLGVERVFWERGERKLVAVVWFGGALSGWPGVTHGGLIGTVLTEKIALANALANDMDGDGTAAAVPQRLPGTGNHAKMPAPSAVPPEPAQLSLTYVKPTYANNFHVIRVSPSYASEGNDDDLAHPLRGAEWEATLETPDTKTCVKATAKFAPTTRLERAEARLARSAQTTYSEFREWMWPSRQRSSQVG